MLLRCSGQGFFLLSIVTITLITLFFLSSFSFLHVFLFHLFFPSSNTALGFSKAVKGRSFTHPVRKPDGDDGLYQVSFFSLPFCHVWVCVRILPVFVVCVFFSFSLPLLSVSICLFICLYSYLLVSLSVHQPIHSPIHHLPILVYIYTSLSFYLSVYLFIDIYLYPYMHTYTCMYV